METGIEMAHAHEALDHEPSAGGEHRRESDLGDDKRSPTALTDDATARAARLFVQSSGQRAARMLEGGHEREREGRQHGDGRRERENTEVNADDVALQERLRRARSEQPRAPVSDGYAERAADQRQ